MLLLYIYIYKRVGGGGSHLRIEGSEAMENVGVVSSFGTLGRMSREDDGVRGVVVPPAVHSKGGLRMGGRCNRRGIVLGYPRKTFLSMSMPMPMPMPIREAQF